MHMWKYNFEIIIKYMDQMKRLIDFHIWNDDMRISEVYELICVVEIATLLIEAFNGQWRVWFISGIF